MPIPYFRWNVVNCSIIPGLTFTPHIWLAILLGFFFKCNCLFGSLPYDLDDKFILNAWNNKNCSYTQLLYNALNATLKWIYFLCKLFKSVGNMYSDFSWSSKKFLIILSISILICSGVASCTFWSICILLNDLPLLTPNL